MQQYSDIYLLQSHFAVNKYFLHLVGFLLTLNYDARNHELKMCKYYLYSLSHDTADGHRIR